MRKFYLVILCIIYGLNVHSQQSSYNKKVLKYTSKNGLSYGFITGIAQDKNGFMWFATEDGLNRFDGINFKVFKHNSDNPYSLPSNYIDILFKDKQGDIWLSSRRGLYQFDTNTEKFTPFEPQEKELINNVSCVTAGEDNILWFSSYGVGFFSYNKTTHLFKNYNTKNLPGLIKNGSTNIFQDSKGLLWLGADGINSVFAVKNGKVLKNVSNDIPLKDIPKGRVNSIAEDHFTNVWIATSTGLAVYNRKLNRVFPFYGSQYQLRSNYFYSVTEDGSNNLLIGLQDGGIYKLDLEKAQTSDFKNISIDPVRTEDDINVTERTIEKLYVDKDKNVWAGTYGDGIYLLGNVPEKFKRFRDKLADQHSAGFLRYYGICFDDEGNLWMGTDGDGIYEKKLDGETIKHNYADAGAPVELKNVAILSAFNGKENLWFGSYAHGLFKYNKRSGNFTNYKYGNSDLKSLCANDVRAVFEDSGENLWVGTNGGGISLLKKGENSFINFSKINNPIGSNNIRAICEDGRGDIFIGTYGSGLICYPKGQDKFFSCFTSAQTDRFLQSRVIYSLKCYDNKLLIGTEGDGLLVYDLMTKAIKKITEKNGLANNTINAIQQDDFGNIWVSTNKGLSEIEKDGNGIRNYDTSNGLQTGHFSPGSSMYCPKAKLMCFGGTEGYNIFYPGEVKKSDFKPRVIITGLQLFNKDVEVGEKDHILSQAISNSARITLGPDQSVFSIQYVALNYAYAERSEFAYRLEGLDKTWNYVQNQKSATYRYLGPGDYVFRVKASNQDGVWSADYASIKIRVLPPWYKTWYACTAYILALIMLIYSYLRYKSRQARLKYNIKIAQVTADKEKELNEKKLAFFTNVSHEFRTPLTLIINPVKELLHRDQDAASLDTLQVIHRNAKRLLSLVDQLLLFRKADTEADKLKIVKLNIVDLCREVFLCFNHQAKAKNIQFSFYSAAESADVYADREKMEIVLFNLISNALKFTPDNGAISCSLAEDAENVIIRIKDSGCGIAKGTGDQLFDRFFQVQNSNQSQGGFGIGLYLVKTFTESHKGTITYESEQGTGTAFNITLLKGKKHFGGSFIFEDVAEPSVFLDELMEDDPVELANENPAHKAVNNYDTLLSSKKALVVIEDNLSIRHYIVHIFQDMFEVFEADNAEDGYNLICKVMPAVVISDIRMNGLSGIELCSRIKNDPSLTHIPFILLTANALPEVKLEGLECGADDCITKPFEKEVLIARVNGLVKNHESLHTYFYNEVTLKSNNLKISADYKEFLERCIAIVEAHLEDDQFSIKNLSDEIGMSHSNLYKRIRAISGKSANEFIRYIRLRKSAEIMINTNCTVAEAAYKVGINNAKYFREQFSKLFGINPSDYIKKFREPFIQAGLRNTLKIKR